MQNTIFVIFFFPKKEKKIQLFSNSHQKIFLINFIINLLLFTKEFLLAFMETWSKAVLLSTFFKHLFLTLGFNLVSLFESKRQLPKFLHKISLLLVLSSLT